AAPVREQWPLLAIGDDVLQPEPAKAKLAAEPKAPINTKALIKSQALIHSKAPAKAKDAAKPTRARARSLATKAVLFAALMLAGTAAIAVALQGKLPLLAYEPLKASRLFADASPATEATVA